MGLEKIQACSVDYMRSTVVVGLMNPRRLGDRAKGQRKWTHSLCLPAGAAIWSFPVTGPKLIASVSLGQGLELNLKLPWKPEKTLRIRGSIIM